MVYAVVSQLLSLEDQWAQELTRKRQMLVRYHTLQEAKAKVAQSQQALKAAVAKTEGQFLSGANTAMASSDLQEILKNLTTTHGVSVSSTKVMQARDAGPYLEVPIQVQLSGTMAQLLTILYHLEHHQKLLFIPELDINAPRWMSGGKESGNIQVNLVVAGVIKKGVRS